jgi:DNA-binding MarR family transcriptional regulator
MDIEVDELRHAPGSQAPEIRPDIAALMALLQEISWKSLRQQRLRIAHFGLTAPQAFALHAIDRFGPEVDMVTISTNTLLPASSITSIVDRLHGEGLVDRHRSETDRRRVTASTTERGHALVLRIEAESTRTLGRLLDDIEPTDVQTVTTVFQHLNRQLDRPDEPAK